MRASFAATAPPVESLHLVTYPADVLRARAKPLEKVTDEVRAVARRMVEIMREHEGIGLAAPQVGLSWRLFIADVPRGRAEKDEKSSAKKVKNGKKDEGAEFDEFPTFTDGVQFYVNPKLTKLQGALEPYEEGCLSLPDIRGDVLRPPVATISALDLEGKPFTRTAAGLLARCWQHEMDHLDGVLILDKMTQMSRLKNRAAVRELEKE